VVFTVSDQNILAPNTVLTSFLLDVSKTLIRLLRRSKVETLLDRYLNLGRKRAKMRDGIVYIAPFHSLENKISDDIKSKLELSK
jgi:basic membrane protein A and related proteins